MNVYDKVTQYGLYGLLEGANRQSNGDTFFVNSACGSNAAGYGSSWDAPYATVNYAVAQCTSGNGDVILVAAGHTESISATSTASGSATGQFCVDKSDVTILGMGRGTKRPTFTMTTAAAAGVKIVGTAANVTLANLLFISDYTGGLTAMIAASANCYGLTIENCEFRDDASNSEEYLVGITLAANIEDVTIRGCKFVGTAGGSSTAVIKTAGDADRLEIYDNWFRVDTSAAVLDLDATAIYDVDIHDNYIYNVDASLAPQISLNSSSTGVIRDNVIHCGLGGNTIVAANCVVANNTVTSKEGASAQPLRMLAGPGGAVSVMQTFYVDDRTGASDSNNGTSWETCFATIGAAIDACIADNGDVIMVGANFAQEITGVGTSTEFDVDCNGISIIGCGNGNDRPTFTFTTDANNAQCYVTGVDCKLENLRFVGSKAALVELLNINADGLQVINCHFTDDGADEALSHITIDTTDTTGGSRTLIKNCLFESTAGGATNTAIYINKDLDNIVIEDNVFRGEYDDIVILTGSASHESTNLLIQRNVIENSLTGVGCVSIYAGITGIIRDNTFRNDDRDEFLVAGSCNAYNNVWMDVAGDAGVIRTFDDPTKNPGTIFFVDSGATNAADTAGCGMSWDQPFATVDAAITASVADAGSEIHVAPGHAETLAAADGLDLDVAGVAVIGHGTGSNRPTFTIATDNDEAAPVVFGANNCTIKNCRFIGGKAGGSKVPIHILASYATIEGCEFYEDVNTNELAVADNFGIIYIDDTAAARTNITIKDCDFNLKIGGNDESAIMVGDGSNGTVDLQIIGCTIHGTFADAALQLDAGNNHVNGLIKDCIVANINAGFGATGACLQCGNTSVFRIIDCHFLSTDDDAVPIVDVTKCFLSNCRTCDEGSYDILTGVGSATNWA